jgi:hypothetical protein
LQIGDAFTRETEASVLCAERQRSQGMGALEELNCFTDVPARRARACEMLEGARDREMVRSESPLANLDYLPPELLCGLVLSKCLTHDSEAREHRRNLRALFPLASLYIQQTNQQGLGQLVRGFTEAQPYKIVEDENDVGIVSGVLGDIQQPLNERLGPVEAAAQNAIGDQTAQRGNNAWVVRVPLQLDFLEGGEEQLLCLGVVSDLLFDLAERNEVGAEIDASGVGGVSGVGGLSQLVVRLLRARAFSTDSSRVGRNDAFVGV